jgi:hypothetical protein
MLLGTNNFFFQNRQVFGLYMLNQQRFPTMGLFQSSFYTGLRFIQGSAWTTFTAPVYSTHTTDHHDTIKLLLKVELKHPYSRLYCRM